MTLLHWLGLWGVALVAFALGYLLAAVLASRAFVAAAREEKPRVKAAIYCCGELMEPESSLRIADCPDLFLRCFECGREVCVVPHVEEPVAQPVKGNARG